MTTTKNEPKREAAIKAEISRDESGKATELRLVFANGEALRISERLLNPTLRAEALLHGLKQKLVDAAAISRNPDTGKSATIADKFNAVMDVYNRLTVSGLWNEPREGGGNVGGLLLRALIRMNPAKDPETLKAWLEGKTDKEKAALRANPKVAAVIAEIQAEKPDAAGIDTDAMLDELGE